MKYAVYNMEGLFIKYCNDSTVDILPENAVELTDEQWDNRHYIKKDMITGDIVSHELVLFPDDPTGILEQARIQLTRVVHAHLDTTAKARGYDSIFTACTYEGDPNPVWSAEGTAYKAWRSAVWQYCLTVLAAVQAQTRAIPTESELLAELPVFGG